MMVGMILKRLPVLVLFAVIAGVLSGCYLPARFDVEMHLNRQGYYDIIFDGYLVDVQIYEALRKGKLTPAEERKEVAILIRDVKRSPATKEFYYIRKGYFKIHWRRKGDLIKDRMVNFLRRDKPMLTLQYVRRTGLITMRGSGTTKAVAKQLFDVGLNMRGEVRFITDAKVISNNATRVKEKKGSRETTYIWKIKSIFDRAPKLEISVR
jgi:hypothetical protein